MLPDNLPVMEIFGPTIQGEGALAGQLSHFVRFGGCNYRCVWCDSMHAVDPVEIHKNARRMSAEQILSDLQSINEAHPAKWVTLSGGDPCMYDLTELVNTLLMDFVPNIAVETQGAFWEPWLESCNHVTVSPKGPSSGMYDNLDMGALSKYVYHLNSLGRMCFKVVIFSKDDLYFAARLHKYWPEVPFYLSVGTPRPLNTDIVLSPEHVTAVIMERYRWLTDEVLKLPGFSDVTVLPQLHAMLWGHKKGV